MKNISVGCPALPPLLSALYIPGSFLVKHMTSQEKLGLSDFVAFDQQFAFFDAIAQKTVRHLVLHTLQKTAQSALSSAKMVKNALNGAE
jgi:hypothetical protein